MDDPRPISRPRPHGRLLLAPSNERPEIGGGAPSGTTQEPGA
jgi:hypothetical protein